MLLLNLVSVTRPFFRSYSSILSLQKILRSCLASDAIDNFLRHGVNKARGFRLAHEFIAKQSKSSPFTEEFLGLITALKTKSPGLGSLGIMNPVIQDSPIALHVHSNSSLAVIKQSNNYSIQSL